MRKHPKLKFASTIIVAALLSVPAASLTTNDYDITYATDGYIPIENSVSYETPTPDDSGAWISTNEAARGYVLVSAVSGSRVKAVVKNEQSAQYYDLDQSGSVEVLPLTASNGKYTISIMENVDGSIYRLLRDETIDVVLDDETQPYLRENIICRYDYGSPLTAKAISLASNANNEEAAANSIISWVTQHVAYDHEKAEALAGKNGYVPSPQDTFDSRTGICYDYASLTAAMLRSVGIPCKIVTGYIDTGEYHSWNEVYYLGKWRTVDPTLLASNAISNQYTKKFTY